MIPHVKEERRQQTLRPNRSSAIHVFQQHDNATELQVWSLAVDSEAAADVVPHVLLILHGEPIREIEALKRGLIHVSPFGEPISDMGEQRLLPRQLQKTDLTLSQWIRLLVQRLPTLS